ncbi:sensor histidine kinase [Caulobacter sp. KR2-114]|uniref:sensor histidine kinase n=1 Tax=Caulobacter sp. KR2-114 TaxID=3400912 RepID=UPI003C0E8A7F
MRLSQVWRGELWRVSTFRLTMLYGVLVALGMLALLGMIYLQSVVYLTQRVDSILNTEADALARSAPAQVGQRIDEALSLDGTQSNVFALFDARGRWLAGNLHTVPAGLRPGGKPMEAAPTVEFPVYARLLARRLRTGQVLVVGRDVNQLREMRTIIASALIWSGGLTIVVVIGLATLLSLSPLLRLQKLKAASEEIAAGDLKRRMPTSPFNDELDMFAVTVNAMMDEVERLLTEVRGVSETIAHDLRTPLTRARSLLHRLQQGDVHDPRELGHAIDQIDVVLERFRALLRISELENRHRRAGFTAIDLAQVCHQVVELYQPLAEEEGVTLILDVAAPATVEADPKLLFEAISNLVDNAIKFTGRGGTVGVRLRGSSQHPVLVVEDNGPGVAESERTLVLQRFYRSEHDRLTPGSGLGLSIVAAILRLHRFRMALQDAGPGLKVVIDCS